MKPEILSPAGNKEMLIAAVRSGADAVYLGASDFNARRNADNFGEGELSECIGYCHNCGVKVYLALNTLISDSEREPAVDTAVRAAKMGIDGIIIQDLGLVKLLKEALPKIPLHASTQMSVHTPEALYVLKKLGISRVVAAREMTKKELTELCNTAAELGIEVEVFVHGALCMCVSGQCLFSAVLGGRSGNRGLCAGPCRLPFSVGGKNEYALSLKDLCLKNHIEELCKMGVKSLKIEGRMKTPEYVAAATSTYRKVLDGTKENTSFDALSEIFSRGGFTDGYFEDKINDGMYGIRSEEEKKKSKIISSSLHEIYRYERKNVPITAEFIAKEEEPVSLTLSDGENEVKVFGMKPERAVSKPIDFEFCFLKLSKLGDTPFILEKLSFSADDGLAVSGKEINALKKEALEKLTYLRSAPKSITTHGPDFAEQSEQMTKSAPLLFTRFQSLSQVPDNTENIDKIILPFLEINEEICAKNTVIAELPRGMSNLEDVFLKHIDRLKAFGIKEIYCGNLSAVNLAVRNGFKPFLSQGMNIFNSDAQAVAKTLGAEWVTVSPELKLCDAKRLSDKTKKGIIAYGRLPLMLLRNCPIKADVGCKNCRRVITDRTGTDFPMRCGFGFSEIFNSVPIVLSDKKSELLGLDFSLLFFTDETKDQCDAVIRSFINGSAPKGQFTRGLYFKGVI